MKKIAIITPFLARGGLEKVAVLEAIQLNKYFDVTLIVLDSFIQDYPYDGKMIDLGVALENRSVFKRITNMFLTVSRLKKIKNINKFDIVISHGELANIPNVLSGGDTILTIHHNRFGGVKLKDTQSRFVNKIINFIYTAKGVKKIVTVSEGIRYSFLEHLNVKEEDIVTVPNPHNISEIIKKSKEPLNEFEVIFDVPVLINVARLIKQKGQWHLLRIFSEVKKTRPNVKLILLGDAGLKDELIALSKTLNLNTYSIWGDNKLDNSYDVYFLGFQSNPFMFMHKSKFFLMTSFWEGLPNTIIEALASGLAVISADCKSGPREILFPQMTQEEIVDKPKYGKNGILIPAFNSTDFLNASIPLIKEEIIWIETLIAAIDEKGNIASSEECLKRAENFEMNKVVLVWKKLIDECI